MTTPVQVANAFAVEFVEAVAKTSADLRQLYDTQSQLLMDDFELGQSEATGIEAGLAAQNWSVSLQGSRIRVESVSAAPVYSGVNVFINLTATDKLQQYFQIFTTLEAFHDGYLSEGYFIRSQAIARIGAVAVEVPAPPVVEEKPAPVEVVQKREATPQKRAASAEPEAPTPASAVEPAAAAAEEEAKPAPAAPAAVKPSSWAKALGAAPSKVVENKPVHVVAGAALRESAAAAKAAAAAAAKAAAPAAGAPKTVQRREKRAPEAVGDRLMFSISGSVTDDEIRTALGSMLPHLISLRNNSAKGLVFMDFAENVQVFEELTKEAPLIGATKVKMSVFRQRPREA